MKTITTFRDKVCFLQTVLLDLWEECPVDCHSVPDEMECRQVPGHWSGTRYEVASWCDDNYGYKGVRDGIVTLLSLSRYHGPTPSLEEEESSRLMKYLWPQGNDRGIYLCWDVLAEKLSQLVNELDNN